MPGYNPIAIEKKWQQHWAANKTFATDARDTTKPKYYVLDMFPYPSGSGLHVGHPEGYTATDILARYKRAKGFNVMHPMGWDAFGLPAEQYAIKNNVHPRATTAANIDRFRKQLQALGFSYDWEREVNTTDPGYYRWTQWIFLKLYDTWFDEKQQRGRPIEELIAEFESGMRACSDGPTGRAWSALTPSEQRNKLAQYRLAYESEAPVNWCQTLGTVLSNEEVIDGKSEVGGFPVERKPMRQWMLRITAYANRLITGLEKLEWSESLKEMQRNWIGQSEGAEVRFQLSVASGQWSELKVFTTRPDTLFGATYMVIAPEHPLAGGVPAEHADAVKKYQNWAASRSDRERQEDTRKTGVWTGLNAINPVNGKTVPIWVSDYVLMGYGTGAIMAVPAHDDRDFEFAKKFSLPIEVVVADSTVKNSPDYLKNLIYRYYGHSNGESIHHDPHRRLRTKEEVSACYFNGVRLSDENVIIIGEDGPGTTLLLTTNSPVYPSMGDGTYLLHLGTAHTEPGFAVNSPWIEGLPTREAKSKMISILEEKGIGKRQVNYKIRDWLFSRQRYWGEPFPIVHLEDGTTVALAESELPLELPELEDFRPTGTIEPPLSKAKEWVEVWVMVEKSEVGSQKSEVARVVPEGTVGAVRARRELNTMPQWAGSCWYYIRYLDPKNSERFVDPAIEKYWLRAPDGNPGVGGVDMYVGGVEHAVLHLLYSRFWHKVLFDWNLVSSDEPFKKLVNQGLILGEMEYTAFKDSAGSWMSTTSLDIEVDSLFDDSRFNKVKLDAAQVEKKGDHFVLKENHAIRIDARSFKMSKSRGNVVNPDDVIKEYGADSLRLFEMFMGPLEQVKPWSTAGVEGVYRFLQRVWRNMIDSDEPDANKANKLLERHSAEKWWTSTGDLPVEKHAQAEADYQAILRPLHRTIKKVTDDIERLSFNTAIAAMMEFNNALAKVNYITLEVAEAFLRLLEPFAPHFADEVLSIIRPDLRGQGVITISQRPWPTVDPAMLIDATIEVPVQINGKLRARITLPNDADEATAIAAALADAEVRKHVAGKDVKKKIYVKGRMVNLVV